jgi:hypothetical protein
MATSNSTNFEPNVTEFVEEAFERCGLELRTGYDLKTARRSINLMLAEWANRGLNQWTIEQDTQTVTEGTSTYTLNANIIDILDVVVRRTVNQTQTDISMDRISRSEYLNIPNKNTKARPTQFYFEKTTTPKLYLWPAPENSTDKFISYRWKRIQDATAAVEDIDIPSRFMPCLTSGLAFYLAMKRNPDKVQILQPMYEQNLLNALRYDEDRTSVHIVPRRTYM